MRGNIPGEVFFLKNNEICAIPALDIDTNTI